LYQCRNGIGIWDDIDCPHVPILVQKREKTHRVIAVVPVADLVAIGVTGKSLKERVILVLSSKWGFVVNGRCER
jgi:hypothetical protein